MAMRFGQNIENDRVSGGAGVLTRGLKGRARCPHRAVSVVREVENSAARWGHRALPFAAES